MRSHASSLGGSGQAVMIAGLRQILQQETKAPVDELRVVTTPHCAVGHQRRGVPIEGHLTFADGPQPGIEAASRGFQEQAGGRLRRRIG
jgi:hypothetical protein